MKLDEFYTRPDLAEKFAKEVSRLNKNKEVLFVEPSAGNGSFLKPLMQLSRKVRALDINPKLKGIKQGDFLKTHKLFTGKHPKIVVIGNPPFGKNASLAVKFFNQAAKHADVIAFVLPRTFRKASLQSRLHKNFHLIKDEDLPYNSFIKDGKPHDVPCAWQIWERKLFVREKPNVPNISHLIQYTSQNKAEFAMRRVGFYAGKIITDRINSLSITSHYFMRAKNRDVIRKLQNINWLDVVTQTSGVRSLSKSEIAIKLSQ